MRMFFFLPSCASTVGIVLYSWEVSFRLVPRKTFRIDLTELL